MKLYSRLISIKNSKIELSETIESKYLIKNLDIVYINLKHRTDRKKELIEEFHRLSILNFKRFNAVYDSNGTLGCALSHRNLLINWNSDDNGLLMICEDDISFYGNKSDLNQLLGAFINDINLDILCLGFNNFNGISYNNLFYLSSDIQTTSCYIVKNHMKSVLIDHYSLSVKLLKYKVNGIYGPEIDQVWKMLQKKFNFVIPKNRFAYQRKSFSDISRNTTEYKV